MTDERNKAKSRRIEEIEEIQASLLKSIEEAKALTKETDKIVKKARKPTPES